MAVNPEVELYEKIKMDLVKWDAEMKNNNLTRAAFIANDAEVGMRELCRRTHRRLEGEGKK